MAKEKQTKKAKKDPLLVTHERADGSKEYIITKSPAKTITGRIIVGVLLFVMVVLPLIALIVEIFQAI